MSRPALSVVVLCYRAGEATRPFAAQVQAALDAAGLADHQLVLVGNYLEGTDDPTPDVVRQLAAADPRITCSAVAKRGMMGWDMRSGLALASGEALAIIDGDGQVLPGDLVRLYHALTARADGADGADGGADGADGAAGACDLVLTHRVRRGDGLLRRTISRLFNLAFTLLFPGLGVHDINAKPKILRRAAFDRLRLTADDWFIDAEIMIQARRLGLRVRELPTEFLGLSGRDSFVNLRTALEFLRNLARHRWQEWRNRR